MGRFSDVVAAISGKGASPVVPDRGYSYADQYNTQAMPNDAKLVKAFRGVAFACATYNAEAVADVPIRLYVTTGTGQSAAKCKTAKVAPQRLKYLHGNKALSARLTGVEVEEVTSHPLIDLLHTPNSEHDGYLHALFTQLYQEVIGESYWKIVNDVMGVPGELWVLQSQLVTQIPGKDGQLIEMYEYGHGKHKEKYTPEEVIPFYVPDLNNPYTAGYAPMEAAWEALNLVAKDRSFAAAYMDNMNRPDSIVSPKTSEDALMGAGEAKRLSKVWDRIFNRGGAGRTVVSPHPMDVTPLSFNSRDMEVLARYGVSKLDIANAFHVPMSFLEDKSVNRATAEAGIFKHAKFAVEPRLRKRDARLNHRLVPLYDERLFLASDDPVPGNEKEAAIIRKMNLDAGVSAYNEERRLMNLEELDGGDEPMIANNKVRLSEVAAPVVVDMAPAPTEEKPTEPVETEPTEQDIQTLPSQTLNGAQIQAATGIVSAVAAEEIPRDTGIGQLEVLLNLTPTQAEQIMGEVGRGFAPEKPDVPPALAGNLPPVPDEEDGDDPEKVAAAYHLKAAETLDEVFLTPGQNNIKAAFDKWFERQRKDIIKQLKAQKSLKATDKWAAISLEDWNREMARDLEKVYTPFWVEAGENADTLLRRRVDVSDWAQFSVKNPAVAEALRASSIASAVSANRYTAEQVNGAMKALAEVYEGDNLPRDMVKKLDEVFDGWESWRSKRIARTESSKAAHDARVMAAGESGVVTGFKPLISSDACAICLAIGAEDVEVSMSDAAGQVGEYGKNSVDGDGGLIRDGRQLPPYHVNCQCSFMEVLVSD